MQTLNKWTGIGRLSRDPEVKTTQSGTNVCSFTLACERRKGKDEEKAEVDWINCVAWRTNAGIIGQFCKKGDQIAIDGRLQTRSYEDKDGKRVYVTEVVAEFVQFLGKKNADADAEEKEEKPSYPNNGNSLTRDEISRQISENKSDDLPF